MALLEIKDLHASIGETEILHGIDLTILSGEVHAIMAQMGLVNPPCLMCYLGAMAMR